MKKPRRKIKQGLFLLSVGDELLDGRTTNTNASWLGEQLRLTGLPVAEIRCVSDRIEDIAEALTAARAFPAVVVTGGLGPTNDDRTMQAAAQAFHLPLEASPASIRHVRERYLARKLELTEARSRLALLPKGAVVIDNPTGTAPGADLQINKTSFYFLPGPPTECQPMFTATVLPALQKKIKGQKLLRRDFWRTFGAGESDVYQRVAPLVKVLEERHPRTISFGVHISFPCVDLTLEVWDIEGEKRPNKAEIDQASELISKAVEELCFTRQRETLPEVVSALLRKQKLTVACAESCTGGLVAKLLTDLPGSSAFFQGGVVAYANKTKEIYLGVRKATLQKHGAVSEAAVTEMAQSIRKKLKTDYALALSGISGPTGGSKRKPVGTIYVALSQQKETKTLHRLILGGKCSRDQHRVIAAHLALNLLRAEILLSHSEGIPVH